MARILSTKDRSRWWSRLRQASSLKKEHEKLWKRMLGYYRNNYYSTTEIQPIVDHQARVNYVFSTVRTIIPSVYFQNPYLLVQPRRLPEDLTGAHTLEIALNYYFQALDLKSHIRAIVLDTLLFGTGIVKIGYSSEFGTLETFPKDPTLQSPMINEALTILGKTPPSSTPDTPHDDRQPMTFNEYIRSESPFAYRVSPFDVLLDPDARVIGEASWVAHRTVQSLSLLRKNALYQHTDRLQASSDAGTLSIPENERRGTSGTPDEDGDRVAVWELWDKAEEQVFWLADGYEEDALRHEDWKALYKMEGFPFEVLQFEEDPERFWTIPMVAQIEDQVLAINEITSKQINHLRRFNRKYGIVASDWNDETLATLKNPYDGACVKVKSQGAVFPLMDAPLSPDVYNSLGEQRQEVYELSGVADYLRGQSIRSKTATEATIVAQGFNIRVLEKVDLLEEFVAKIGRKMIQVMKQYTPERQLVSITGRTGNRETAWLSREAVDAEVDVQVDAGSTQVPNKEILKKQALDLYNILRADPMVDGATLIHHLLETYDIKDPEAYMAQQGPSPSEVAHAQDENALMMQGQTMEVLPSDDHAAHLYAIQVLQHDPRWAQIFPQNQQLIHAHAAQHQAALQQARGQGQPGGGTVRQMTPEAGRPVNPALFAERAPRLSAIAGGVTGV